MEELVDDKTPYFVGSTLYKLDLFGTADAYILWKYWWLRGYWSIDI